MGEIIDLRRGLAAAASLSVIAGLLAACSPGPSEPAPVYVRNAGPTLAKKTPPAPARDNTIFTVQHGDTVIEIAHAYRVPLGALIAANRLSSPYLIHPGDRILIPDGGVPPGAISSVQVAAAAPAAAATAPPQTAATPALASTQVAATPSQPVPAQVAATLPPKPPAAVAPTQLASAAPPAPPQITATASQPAAQTVTAQARTATPPVTVAANPLIPPVLPPSTAAAPVQPQPPAQAASKTTPAVVPLDPPAKQLAAVQTPTPVMPTVAPPSPVASTAVAPQPVVAAVSTQSAVAPAVAAPQPVTPVTTPTGLPSVLAARNPAAALPLPGEAAPAVSLQTSSGRFLWPVHGRVLASYGSANGGPHNEGINIAAPLGTPVRTIDSGTVAYVGNEVKGYGNLVLVRHANGWISAYAHLDDVTVKKGDTVAAGEVIAKVGDTGIGVPQLHFELRRGKKPVDPENFLDPAGSAAARPAQKAG